MGGRLDWAAFHKGVREWWGLLRWLHKIRGGGRIKASLNAVGPRLFLADFDCRHVRLIGTANPYTAIEVHPLPGGLWEDTPNGLLAGDVFEANLVDGLESQIAKVCRDLDDWRFVYVREGEHGCVSLAVIVRDCGGTPIEGATVHVTGPGGFDWTGTTDATGWAYVPIDPPGETYHVEVDDGVNSDSADIDTSVYCIWGFCLGGKGKARVPVVGCCLGGIGAGVTVNAYHGVDLIASGVTDSDSVAEMCLPEASLPYTGGYVVTFSVDSPPSRYGTGSITTVAPPVCATRTYPLLHLPPTAGYGCFSCCGQMTPCAGSATAPDPTGSIEVTDPVYSLTATMVPDGLGGWQSDWVDKDFPGCFDPSSGAPLCPDLTFSFRYSVVTVTSPFSPPECRLKVEVRIPHYNPCPDFPDTPYNGSVFDCDWGFCPVPVQWDGIGLPVDPLVVASSGPIEFLSCSPGFSGTATFNHPGTFCPVSSATFTLLEV